MSRPRSPSVCHHEATRATSGSASPWRAASPSHTGPAATICSSSGRGCPSYPSGRTPSRAASRGHSQRHRNTSPFATLNACRRRPARSRPTCMLLGEQAGVGHVRDAVPLRLRTGEDERLVPLAADRGLHRQRLAHVHRVADGVADDRVRPVDAPGEAVARGGGEELVLLGVVEVRVGRGAPRPRGTACPARRPGRRPRTARGSA